MSDGGVSSVLRWIWAFQDHANDGVLKAAAEGDALRRPGLIAGGHGDGSLYETLAHLVAAEEHWLRRWQGDPNAAMRNGADFAGLNEIRSAWHSVREQRRDWLRLLDDAQAVRELDFVRLNGLADRQVLWQTVLHVANHSTHHRAEAATALSAVGSPPESLDVIDFMRVGSPGTHGFST